MWHAKIAIFAHHVTPAQQCVYVGLTFSACEADSFLHKLFPLYFVLLCSEAHRENSKNKNKHLLLLLFCQLTLHAGKVPEQFVQLVWNKVRGSQLHTETPGHFIHVNAHKQHAAGDNKDVRGRQGCNANLRLSLHMSVTHSCCQDQHHHFLGKRGSNSPRMQLSQLESIYIYIDRCVCVCVYFSAYFTLYSTCAIDRLISVTSTVLCFVSECTIQLQ